MTYSEMHLLKIRLKMNFLWNQFEVILRIFYRMFKEIIKKMKNIFQKFILYINV